MSPRPGKTMDDTDRDIINALQGEFPLCARPYAAAGERLGISEDERLRRLTKLLAEGTLSRFGPMYQIERMGGAFCLAAMSVPEPRYAEVTQTVNGFHEVAHNYRREHSFNMWFVLATESAAEIEATARRVEAATGLPVCLFPKEEEFFVDLRLRA